MKLIEHFIDGKKFSGISKRTGKIFIKDMLNSPILNEFHELK